MRPLEHYDEVWAPFRKDECEASERGNLKFEPKNIRESCQKRGLPVPPLQDYGRQTVTLMPFVIPPDAVDLFVSGLDVAETFFKVVKHIAHITHTDYRLYHGSLSGDPERANKLKYNKDGSKNPHEPKKLVEHHCKFKSMRRACQKVARSNGKFASLCDIVQASMVYPTVEELVYALRLLRKDVDGVDVVGVDDSFNATNASEQADSCGYPQTSVYVRMKGYSHICEVNFHVKRMYYARKAHNQNGAQGRLWLWKDTHMAL